MFNIIEKFEKLLGDEKELCLIKGKVTNLKRHVNKNGEEYFTINVKSVRGKYNNGYDTFFNFYDLVLPASLCTDVKNLESEIKGSECLFYVLINNSVQSGKKDDKEYSFNNTRYFVKEFKKVADIVRDEEETIPMFNI